ncbi:hypothetical protein LSCM1_02023 [Leishmania martiniquensis]|uniref:Uncharacterized protein n=1 Tax=Leishmania martiniquensis TaxID=1580590 RepID=A0A836GCA1_9TRYP|nr:hypothetical protein LSCM1_02023 [Leishmania martiniquensis]
MMASLPVLHLKATSKQNVTVSTDLCDTTMTLYTFLRSIPSAAETERALRAFLESLHASPSSGRASLMRRPNHGVVGQLESVAMVSVFCGTPHVLPALARHSDRWLRKLGYASMGDETADSASAMDAAGQVASGLQHAASSSNAGLVPFAHIRATDMRAYADAYSAYEANYVVRHAAADSPHVVVFSNDQAYAPNSGAAEEASGLQHRGTTQPREEASSVSAEVSALTAPVSEPHLSEPGHSTLHELTQAPTVVITPDPRIHPVLHLIAEEALKQPQQREGRAAEAEGADSGKARGSAPPSSSDAAVEEKVRQLKSRLNEAEAQLTEAMAEKETAEQVWSPYYSRLKTSRMYVDELKSRVQSAASLYLLLRYERDTLQQAHISVAMECMSLQLILRDVVARLQDEPRCSLADSRQQTADDQKLFQQLSAALAASPAASRRRTA